MSLKNTLKSIASKLPDSWQSELKRLQFRHQINKHQFTTDEQEFGMLSEWVSEGDWVLDIGANIGHYTGRLSELVGSRGRVIAFEPVPETFQLLAANMALFPSQNISLLNLAASDSTEIFGIHIPKFDTGLDNFYMAQLTRDEANLQILCTPVDGLNLPHRISFAKIDAEGHELAVLKGMTDLIRKNRPVMVVEDNSPEVADYLDDLGYGSRKIETSSNIIYESSNSDNKTSA